MKIERFEVKGFKNLRQSVVLDELAGVNVIHGENNVGKSNLLQAMDLFFWLLGEVAKQPFAVTSSIRGTGTGWVEATEPDWLWFPYPERTFEGRGYPADEIFNVLEPYPIEWNASIRIDQDDVARTGLEIGQFIGDLSLDKVKASRNPGGGIHVAIWLPEPTPERWAAKRTGFAMIAKNFLLRTTTASNAFILVGTHRRVAGADANEQQTEMRLTIPQQLLLALYDAKESDEPGLFQRWELFEKCMDSLGALIDDGHFVITYQRNRSKAVLANQIGRVRMPIEALGSGIQQIASLLARVLLGNSAIVAIEEPELNLRYDLQLRLRDILKDITESGLGPQQIILTSHSPAFETGKCFYAMTRTADGPTVTRRPVAEAAMFTQQHGVQPDEQRAAFGYVSSDGLLRLSDKTRRDLGVEHGGGVVMIKRESHPYGASAQLSDDFFRGVKE
ncbi:MAG: AAA family ATPase [Deltaproteobacteria bacterium]|nr:AAA family ATPase [Myxococcales bacterium]MDP3217863.1 AAA family ATPase [Deltaproteobacteria bacterium]